MTQTGTPQKPRRLISPLGVVEIPRLRGEGRLLLERDVIPEPRTRDQNGIPMV
jgi:hypothetical protein